MKSNRPTINWMIDAVLFVGFIVLFFLDLTGVALHQWIGVAGGALAIYHLLTHWDWVEAVSKRLFGRITGRTRLYYLVDAAILLGFEAILFSGLIISTWLSLTLVNASAWVNFHIFASIVTLVLVVFKLAIHWRWIVKTAQRMLPQPASPAPVPPTLQPAVVPLRNDRRDFLKMMGVVGAAAAVALLNVAISTNESQAQATSAQSQTNLAAAAGASTSQPNSTSTCIGRCPKGRSCSYPGGCRQYTDSNGNGRCDYGECA